MLLIVTHDKVEEAERFLKDVLPMEKARKRHRDAYIEIWLPEDCDPEVIAKPLFKPVWVDTAEGVVELDVMDGDKRIADAEVDYREDERTETAYAYRCRLCGATVLMVPWLEADGSFMYPDREDELVQHEANCPVRNGTYYELTVDIGDDLP